MIFPGRYHGRWRDHQHAMINTAVQRWQAVQPDGCIKLRAAALLPGSMLFNQMVLDTGDSGTPAESLPLSFESLDEIYRSLLHPDGELSFDNFLLDCESSDSEVLLQVRSLLQKLKQQYPDVRQVAVLGGCSTALRQCCASLQLECLSLYPKWYGISEHLAIYRRARHCLFVDSNRVIDAAMTQCQSTLLLTERAGARRCSGALLHCLSATNHCEVVGAEQYDTNVAAVKGLVCENRLGDLHRALSRAVMLTSPEDRPCKNDWLSIALQGGTEAVVARPVLPVSDFIDRIKLQRIVLKRKFGKLREDPKGFFGDSRNRHLRHLGRLFPGRPVVQRDA